MVEEASGKGPKFVADRTATSMEIPLEELGPAGARGVLVIVPQFRNRPESAWRTDRALRPFRASALLLKAPAHTRDMKADLDAADGSSFFLAPQGKAGFEIETADGVLEVSLNAAGEAACLRLDLQAQSSGEAHDKFVNVATQALDHLSFNYNVPVHIGYVVTEDVNHSVKHVEYFRPPSHVIMGDGGGVLHSELAPIYSLYRECMNSSSYYYKTLCYYKIFEGIFRALRPNLRKRARKVGHTLSRREENVPADGLPESLAAWKGKSIVAFVDNLLTRRFRDAVAHFMVRESSILHLSAPAELRIFADVVQACEVCVRVVIRNHEADFAELRALEAQQRRLTSASGSAVHAGDCSSD